MSWDVTHTQDEASWFEDHIRALIAHEPPALPLHDRKVGHVETHWYQLEPGVAFIASNPQTGTPDDRRLAEAVVLGQLRPHGFKRAVWSLTWDHSLKKYADWNDIMQDAQRLVQTGAVELKRNSANSVLSLVHGDGTDNDGVPDTHNVEISREDPNSQAITGSFCDCGWGQFQNLPRTRQWKRYQNRPCKHILATFWLAQSVPTDESRAPGNQGEEGQMSLFDQSGGTAAPSMGLMQRSPWTSPNAWYNAPGAPAAPNAPPQPGVPGGAPSPEEVLPQFPMGGEEPELPPVNPASTPGGRPGPTPTNPLQYPGGTFSHLRSVSHPARMSSMASLYRPTASQQYQNGDLTRLRRETVGTQVGRSEEHGAGQSVTIPAGSVGEVLGTDPVTQLVNVLFMGKTFDPNTYLEPFGATAWAWPSELQPSSNQPPGPAVRHT